MVTPVLPEVSAPQSPGAEDRSGTRTDAGSSTERKFEEESMPEWGPHEYAGDGVFYCPWTEWHPEDEEECHGEFETDGER